jgi:hypothetical protein
LYGASYDDESDASADNSNYYEEPATSGDENGTALRSGNSRTKTPISAVDNQRKRLVAPALQPRTVQLRDGKIVIQRAKVSFSEFLCSVESRRH